MANKNVHGFLNEIEDYSTFRRIVRDVFLCGYHTPTELSQLPGIDIKERSVRDLLRRLDNYMNSNEFDSEMHLSSHKLPNRKTDKVSRRFLVDSYKYTYNYLASTYMQHTITQSDIIFFMYFLVLMVHEDYDPFEFTLEDYTDILYDFYDDIGESLPLSISQIRAKMDELVDLGILACKANTYSVHESFLEHPIFNSSSQTAQTNLADLKVLLTFFCNTAAISAPGFLLSNKVQLTERFWGIPAENADIRMQYPQNLFFAENARFQNILDDDVVWFLAQAITAHQVVSYDYHTERSSTCDLLLPIKIVCDTTWGRQYLFGYSYKLHGFTMRRIDKLDNAAHAEMNEARKYSFLNSPSDENLESQLNACYEAYISGAFTVSGGGSEQKLQKVILHFAFDNSPFSQSLRQKLLQAVSEDRLTANGDYSYDCQFSVASAHEMLPWINSFGSYVTVDSASDETFYNEYLRNNRETLALYESV